MRQNKILAVDGRFLKLERLDLLNYFLFREGIPREEREELAKEFLSIMLDEKIAKVKITPQKSILADGSECQSVRLDVYMEDVSTKNVSTEDASTEDVSVKSEQDSTGKDNGKNDSKNANEGGGKDDDDQEDDYDEGYDDGFGDGQDTVNLLNLKLVMAGRLADMIRAAGNKEYQEKLFEEFDL